MFYPLTYMDNNAVNFVDGITLSHGKEISLKVVSGENDPSKKPPVEKRPYNKIWNWQAGCPDCGKTPKSKEAFRKHRSDKERCKPKT